MELEQIGDVVVGGLSIRINSPNHDLINSGLLGHYLPANLEIGIRDDLPLQLQGNVLVHEVTHAIANVYCEGLRLDEAQVAGIAQGFYQVLCDNPDIFRFLMQPLHGQDYEDSPLAHAIEEHLANGRDLNTIMNGHVKSSEPIILGHDYDRLGVDLGGH